MRVFTLCLAVILHTCLIAGFLYTLYPKDYTASAKFLVPANLIHQFENDLKTINHSDILDETIKDLDLKAHPITNRGLVRDNTKWSKITLKFRLHFNEILKSDPEKHLRTYVSKMIGQNHNDQTISYEVTTSSAYLSQNLANAYTRKIQNALSNNHSFTTYDVYAHHTSSDKNTTNIIFFPAGYTHTPNARPLTHILIIGMFFGISFACLLLIFRRQHQKDCDSVQSHT